MNKVLKVLLVAGEAAGARVLRTVVGSGHVLAGLMTADDESEQRMREQGRRMGCPVWPARWVEDPEFATRVKAAGVDLLLNVHSLHIVRAEVLAAPRLGSFNMHPGPLPEIAGLNAVSWALYEGKSTHGVTIHRMVPAVDAGPIAYQSRFSVDAEDTALNLSVKCVKAGVPLISELLGAAATDPGAIPQVAQDLSRRRHHGREVPHSGWLVWSRSAREVVNFVRACDYLPFRSPWGHPRARLDGRAFAIVKVSPLEEAAKVPPGVVGDPVGRAIKVAAADRWVLVHRLLCDGELRDAADQLRPGQRFDEVSPKGGEA